MNFPQQAFRRSQRIEPIITSLLSIDFYKLLMLQIVWEYFPNVRAQWSVINRSKVRLADCIDIQELREQLDHVRTLRFQPSELLHLAYQTFYGATGIFKPGFINALKTLQLSDYKIIKTDNGQYEIIFEGTWVQTMLWEIYVLQIINELRSRAILGTFSRYELEVIYAKAKAKLDAKLRRLATLERLNLTCFGTRRRHTGDWQEYCTQAAMEVLGNRFTGTSNVQLALKYGLEPKGTNAHELPMAFAALARNKHGDDKEALRESQYEVLHKWQNSYGGNLLIGLPDTFGSTQFFENAPQWVANWKGFRLDSKNPFVAGQEVIDFYRHKGILDEHMSDKIILPSDGLDVELEGKSNGTDIIKLQRHFEDRIGIGFGFGTNLTNDFIGCAPGADPDALKAISIVCKLTKIDGRSTVKLSDSYSKAMGSPEEIAFYRETFGTKGMENIPALV